MAPKRSMPHDDGAALLDIAYCRERVASFISGRNSADFQSDEALREAVQYRLIVMGEAVKRLSDDFRATHPEFRWSSVAGLRDVLVHAYERVDHREIWNIAAVSVPALRAFVLPLLPDE